MKSTHLSNHINNLLGVRQQRLFGRGSSALWVALEAIAQRDKRRDEVILPDIICTSVLETVLAAGFTPRLADVDAATYTLTPDTITPLLNTQTQAIIVAHIFGHIAPIAAIADLAQAQNIWLIEDAVQGLGGVTPAHTPVGSHGDFAFLSFDPSKMIRGQGGVLRYEVVWEPFVAAAAEIMPARPLSAGDTLLNTSLRDLYHSLGQALRLEKITASAASAVFRPTLPVYRPLLFRAFDDSLANQAQIEEDWQTLQARVLQRNARAAMLREALSNMSVIQPPDAPGNAIWRYTVRFPNGPAANHFVVALRQSGGLASHLYYPLNQLYAPTPAFRSTELARSMVNLWVDERVDSDYPTLVNQAAIAALDAHPPY